MIFLALNSGNLLFLGFFLEKRHRTGNTPRGFRRTDQMCQTLAAKGYASRLTDHVRSFFAAGPEMVREERALACAHAAPSQLRFRSLSCSLAFSFPMICTT